MTAGPAPTDESTRLRQALVDDLVTRHVVRSDAVERALRTIPRERFVPDVDPHRAYEDRPQQVKATAGEVLSTISQPTMIAIMLEASGLTTGSRVLEIGTGSGYNAALLAAIVGETGRVITIDVEADLVASARRRIRRLGLRQVTALAADGRDGWERGGPYDCIMATVGIDVIFDAWREQVADRGRILAPLQYEGRLVVEARDGDHFNVVSTSPARFIPMR